MKLLLTAFIIVAYVEGKSQLLLNKSVFNQTEIPILAAVNQSKIFCSYRNQFFLPQWNEKSVGAAFKKQNQFFGTTLTMQGDEKYGIQNFQFIFGQVFSPFFKMAASCNVQQIIQQEFGTNKPFITPNLSFGISEHWGDLYVSTSHLNISEQLITAPNSMSMYYFKEVDHNINCAIFTKAGPNYFNCAFLLEYNFNQQLFAGLSSQYSNYPIGGTIGVNYKSVEFKYTFNFHNTLPMSNQIVLIWDI